jgi:sulfite oxidase
MELPKNTDAKSVELCCRAVDTSYNVQPESVGPMWNVRGILNNVWHRIHVRIVDDDDEDDDEDEDDE